MNDIAVYKTFEFTECKTEGERGEFSGYASAYAKDLQGDKIAPGAFERTIAKRGGLVPILYAHDMGRPPLGFSTTLAEDAKVLKLAGKLATATVGGNDAYEMLKLASSVGFRMGLSIGFTSDNWEWDDSTNVRTINEVDLWEVSLTPFPAQPKAYVADVKTFRDFEKYLREAENFSRADSRRIMRLVSELNLSSRGMPDGANAHRFLRGFLAQ